MRGLLLCLLLLPTRYKYSGQSSGLPNTYYEVYVTTCNPPYAFVGLYGDSGLLVRVPNPYFADEKGAWSLWSQKKVRVIVRGSDGSVNVFNCALKEGK